MSERVEPINEARGLYSVGRSEWNVTHRFSLTEFLKGGGDDRQEHDWCRGLDRDNANAPVVILRTGWNGWNAMRVLREVTILRRLDHPNIVKIVDILKTQRNIVYVVFQDAGMALDVWLDQKPPPHMSAVTARAIMQQLVGAVGYLHRCSLVHSDMKPASILIHPVTLKVTIANFGQSRVFTGREQLAADCSFSDEGYFMESDDDIDDDAIDGPFKLLERWKPANYNDMPQFSNNYLLCSSSYRAPEMCLRGGSYSQAMDVFSIGCVLGELLHCLPAAAGPDHTSRILFDFRPTLNSSRDDPGKPSQTDVDEYVHAAGNAAVPIFGEFARRREEERIVEVLTTGSKTRTKSPNPKRQYAWDQKVDMSDESCAPVDFAAKYSTAHAECPAALALLLRMLTYSPSNRISCSQALCHQFLNPDGADVAAGDDGDERTGRSAAELQQLDIDGLCYQGTYTSGLPFLLSASRYRYLRRPQIYALLMTEAQVLKFCDRMPFVLAAASALVVYGRCRMPAHVVQGLSTVLGTMLSQRWRTRAPLQGKVSLENERLQLLCCGGPLSALLLRLAIVVDHSGRTSIEHTYVVCIMKRYLSGVARRLWSKCMQCSTQKKQIE